MSTTVANLLDDPLLGLSVEAGSPGLQRFVLTPELNRPCFELTGYFGAYRSERIQVIGKGEATYIEIHQAESDLHENLVRILNTDTPCVIVTNGQRPHRLMMEAAEEAGIPVLSCPHRTAKLYKRLWEHLDAEFAPRTTLHGVLMDIHDVGVLVLGDSAVGKSECALELIRRGFHLVTDDMVNIKCLSDSVLVGYATELLPYHMEARGIGIIDIRRLFGAASVLPDKRINLAITLVEWDESAQYDRTGLSEAKLSILDVDVPHVTIPLRPGRNVGTLVEVAALNHKLRGLGINTAHLMEQDLRERIDKSRKNHTANGGGLQTSSIRPANIPIIDPD